MKNIITIVMILLSVTTFAQITVSTLTPEFKGSGGLSLDSDGSLIVADFGDFLNISDPDGLPNDVWRLDTDLNLNLYSGGFVGASGNDFDGDGVLFQSDIGASGIYKIVNGVRTFVTSTGISNPVGLVFDGSGNFYVCNCGNNTIRKVTPGGVSTEFASGNIFSCPNGIIVDEDDNLYVSNFSNGNIIKITPAGTSTVLNATPGGITSGPSNGHLDYHEPSRTLFIASHGSNRIFALRIDDPGNLIDIAGTGERGNTDGDVSVATFSRPNGVVVTQTGDSIYINSAIPVTNVPNRPLNPQVVRLITGVNSILLNVENNAAQLGATVYPNPVVNIITIEADLSFECTEISIEFYDIHGRIVKELSNVTNDGGRFKISVDISEFNSGTYFYSLSDDNCKKIIGKIIKN